MPLLLEIRLDDARGGIDRSARRLVDDPIDVARRELLLRHGRRCPRTEAARRGAPEDCPACVAQETAPIDPRIAAHPVLLSVARALTRHDPLSAPWAARCPRPFLERIPIQEVCQCNVLRHKARGVDQDALIVALPALLRADDQLLDFRVELLAREQAAFDHALELALQHVEFPAVDDDLVHLRPAGRIELAARQRDEGAARLEPGLAAHHVARRGAADGDVGAAHHLLDRILRDRPEFRAPATTSRAKAARVSGRREVQRISSNLYMVDRHRSAFVPMVPMPTRPSTFGSLGPDPLAGDGRGGGAADGIAPVLVDDGNRLAAVRVRQHDVARAVEAADRVAHAIVVSNCRSARRSPGCP